MSADAKTLSPEEEDALNGADFTSAVPDNSGILSVDDLDEPKKKRKVAARKTAADNRTVAEAQAALAAEDEADEDERPDMADHSWSDYVMRQFQEDELNADGNPLVHGLRRVARKLLGPIVFSGADPFQAPTFLPGLERVGILTPAVVSYTVEIMMTDPEHGTYKATFRDVADCYFGNTDPDYARHASATAATKAEARCLRKALQLRNVSAEETTKVTFDTAAMDGKIVPEQVNFINVLASRNDVNVVKYINAGKQKFESIYDVPYGVAAKMVEHLSGLQNKGAVPEELRGYDRDWRKAN